MQKIFCVLLLIVSFLLLNNPVYALTTSPSRPPSEACSFKAEIVNYKEVTNKIVVNNIEEYKFNLKILESNAPLLPKILSREEAKRACSALANQTVESSWYPERNETQVDKNKVLLKGSVITGEIDSLDHIINKISLVSEGSPNDQKNSDQRIWIVVILIIIFIALIAGLLIRKKYTQKR